MIVLQVVAEKETNDKRPSTMPLKLASPFFKLYTREQFRMIKMVHGSGAAHLQIKEGPKTSPKKEEEEEEEEKRRN